jgi:hypothetical protein
MDTARVMPVEKAAGLYQQLSPFLNVEKGDGNPVTEKWGCYPPRRFGRHSLEDWPLHSWRGPGSSPLCLSWSANPARRPTFDQFVRAYRIKLIFEAN